MTLLFNFLLLSFGTFACGLIIFFIDYWYKSVQDRIVMREFERDWAERMQSQASYRDGEE